LPPAWYGVRANLDDLRQEHPLPALPAQLADLICDQRAFGLEALRLIGGSPTPAPRPTLKPTPVDSRSPLQSPTTHVDALRSAREVPRGTIVARRTSAPAGARAYHAFTEQFDNQADATALCMPSTREALAEQLRRFRRDSTADIAVGRGDSSDICKSSKRASGSSIAKRGYSIARGSRESSSTRRNR
jgi:hypothetical protein